MSVVISRDRTMRPAPGTWRPGPKDPPGHPCPGCGSPLETGPTELGEVLGVCPSPRCNEWVILRPADGGRLTVAERIPRDRRRAGQDRPGQVTGHHPGPPGGP